jgi:thioredoxin-like negative regulator of GroEL
LPPSIKCCRAGDEIPPGWDIGDSSEIDRIVDDCRVVLILFYSDNCLECEDASLTFTDVAERYSGQIAFVRVNVNRLAEISDALGVSRVPSLMLVVDGEIVGYMDGYLDEEELEFVAMEALKQAGCVKSPYYAA